MKSQRPIISSDEHQVLPFRSAATHRTRPRPITATPPAPHRLPIPRRVQPRLAATPGDDFRHRIVSNMAALALTMALTALGIWLVAGIAHLG